MTQAEAETKPVSHTPGPWSFHGDRSSYYDRQGKFIDVYVGEIEAPTTGVYRGGISRVQSCDHIGGISRSEAEANTRLIAASPDLLVALQEIAGGINVSGMTDMVLAGNWHGVVNAMQAKARAAIARATGAGQ